MTSTGGTFWSDGSQQLRKPDWWSDDDWADFCRAVLRYHEQRVSITALESMDPEIRRWAFDLARDTMRDVCGYALCEMNRDPNPKKWSQDFRRMVVSCAQYLEREDIADLLRRREL